YKFNTGRMNSSELNEFRRFISGMSDDELDAMLCNYRPDRDTDADIDEDAFAMLKLRIDTAIGRRGFNRFYKWVSIAASVLLPLLIAAGIYFYREADRFNEFKEVIAGDITIGTGSGESVNTILPDGATLKLGPNSVVTYSLSRFNDRGRNLELDGAGYFDVVRNTRSPFTINTPGVDVRVLGTKFRLSAHKTSLTSELYLAEGSVELHSLLSNETVIMRPRQLASIDNRTGSITLTAIDNDREANAILQGALVFKGQPLDMVLQRLGNAYGRKFDLRTPISSSDVFTGFLPTDNLEEALDVLETSYHLHADVQGPVVILK
ncbi:MAG: FecR domain-containing protein, partial [Muribaculaceae bacterium]|nr:FecR domain-containing protein [Muribaculaceae bacterium]